ncbi:hypothetical protein HELRODRAFT_157296 [Helobdella robusta]|uniref:Phenazine biosynthesis-like domain-containing protein n=1 Tax=Helobdella robusta TaxID=6412 RepID=T1EM89_HELRO|nr:hypothetical protein HELRODRAFT_157296 [Helobdella robusta]ESO00850.1 hypothetical protein HELRODRAFT_157296 [Helobdella robusta]
MLEFPVYIVHAFTDLAFGGNPAAVCLVGNKNLSDDVLQKIAAEMNLSETAFIKLVDDNDDDDNNNNNNNNKYTSSSRFNLRWFTPLTEVNLCGHATLASAAVLFQCCGNQSERVTFDTLSGLLLASRSRDIHANDVISLDFPLNEPQPVTISAQMKDIIDIVDVELSRGTKKLVIRLSDDDDPFDFYSRYFAPWVGIDEDPVTGSAHTVLGPYWSKILRRTSLKAKQCSRRSGIMYVNVDGSNGRCYLKGNAVVVLKGDISI